MAFKVGVGETDFAALRREKAYYVDKTEFLYELVFETNNKVSLFTRPRRFGKTLMLSMMENFFSIRKDSKELFAGYAISEYQEFCEQWMNQYPVLFISFKDVEAETFGGAYKMLKTRLADLCKGWAPVLKNASIDKDDEQIFLELKAKTSDDEDVKNSLKSMMRMLYTIYGKPVILLIDEYDVPLATAEEKDSADNPYYAKMLDIIRGMMSTALKDNEFLQFAVVTGCLRIAKESIFTGTNNFASYSVTDNPFSGYFGFSEGEVNMMLDAADRKESAADIKEWYDGYVFGNSYVYCPWDVINHLSALKKNRDAKPKNYWKNSSHNSILLSFVKRTDFDVADKFETLLNGGTIRRTISDELTYDTLHMTEDNLWSALLMTGYITKANPDEVGDTVSLRIPNREVSSIFEDTVVRFFSDTVNTDVIHDLIDALWEGDAQTAAKLLSDLLWDTISYHDYHENYYHAFLSGIFVGRGYSVDSNKEKGLGRPDILLKDRKNRRAIIIETKKSDNESAMDRTCDEAIKQIMEKEYAQGVRGYEKILCYGVSFFRKQAKVKLL